MVRNIRYFVANWEEIVSYCHFVSWMVGRLENGLEIELFLVYLEKDICFFFYLFVYLMKVLFI